MVFLIRHFKMTLPTSAHSLCITKTSHETDIAKNNINLNNPLKTKNINIISIVYTIREIKLKL